MLVNKINVSDTNKINNNSISTRDCTPSFKNSYEIHFEEDFDNSGKISFSESVKLISKGAIQQCKNILSSIISHPVITILSIGAVSAGLMALPFIGIPTAVGGGILAIGFGALAAAKSLIHINQYINNYKSQNFENARSNLMDIGKDSVDIGLSLPFVPKGISDITKFSKYGKIAKNSDLISQISFNNGIIKNYRHIKDANKELYRKVNYNYSSDKELSKLTNLSEDEKIKIKEYLNDFNIPVNKIPETVIKQYAKEKGIHTLPEIKYETLNWSTNGCAIPNKCEILINDRKIIIKSGQHCDEYELINQKLTNGIYELTYRNKKTGKIINETLEKRIKDDYNNRYKIRAGLSKEANEILTTWHERTHINDFARIYKYKGEQAFSYLTDSAKQRYEAMAREMPEIQAGSNESIEIEKLLRANNNETPAAYIKNERELSARKAEGILMDQERFKTADKVFKEVNRHKTDLGSDIVLNSTRADSSLV